jgi:DNA-binding transcriptional MerR regulator
MATRDLLSVGQVAERADVHRTTVHYWLRTGKLKPATVVAGMSMFDARHVDRFLAERAAVAPPADEQTEAAS